MQTVAANRLLPLLQDDEEGGPRAALGRPHAQQHDDMRKDRQLLPLIFLSHKSQYRDIRVIAYRG